MRFNAPISDGKTLVNKKDAINTDIITVLESNFAKGKEQCKQFAQNFIGANDEETANNVWKYLRHKIKYKRDSELKQQIRLPARLIADAAKGADCKSFSLFACSVLANLGFQVGFRYTSYSNSSTPTHVYCIAKKNGRNYIVDGVWNLFNSEKSYTYKKDHIMQVETLSGFRENMRNAALSNINDLAQLQNFYRTLGNKNTVVAKLVLKRLNPTGQRLPYTKAQIDHYKMVLNRALRNHPNRNTFANKLLTDELTRVNNGIVIGAIFGYAEAMNGIAGKKKRAKKFFKKVGAGLKKVGKIIKKGTLAGPRGAFLTIVKLNVGGIANRLSRAKVEEPAKLLKFWNQFGGNIKYLNIAIGQGKGKKFLGLKKTKKISGIAGIGEPAISLGAAIALAAPLLIVAAKLFKKAPGESDVTTGEFEDISDALKSAGVDASTIDTVKDLVVQAAQGNGLINTGNLDAAPEADASATGIDFSAMLPWVAGAAGLYFLTKGK